MTAPPSVRAGAMTQSDWMVRDTEVGLLGAALMGAATGYATRKAGFLLAVPAALTVAVIGFWATAFVYEKATGRL